ncbi:FH1/FH2 domain-containing protein 1-like [Phyllostomus discolor]|uniref:FH1/FH2 domain-containing protein 1-like n=1 Tax=Phyllostomus discolor TaxID=89673 RepID=A0A7E6CRH5_9CHIR|nr:FH1/FH2 domain-containing protein 1-like [Phyllostomus discolor]
MEEAALGEPWERRKTSSEEGKRSHEISRRRGLPCAHHRAWVRAGLSSWGDGMDGPGVALSPDRPRLQPHRPRLQSPASTIPLPSSIKGLFLTSRPPAALLPWSVPDSLALPTKKKTVKLFWQDESWLGATEAPGAASGPAPPCGPPWSLSPWTPPGWSTCSSPVPRTCCLPRKPMRFLKGRPHI